jgi:hypothetical protein
LSGESGADQPYPQTRYSNQVGRSSKRQYAAADCDTSGLTQEKTGSKRGYGRTAPFGRHLGCMDLQGVVHHVKTQT